MQARYPNQWLFVAEPEGGIPPFIASGIVLLSADDKKELYRMIHDLPVENRLTKVIYTGIFPHETHAWRLVSFSKDQLRTP